MDTTQYIVSARKYRPDSFATMVGQEALTSTLKAAINSAKTAHAYLFCGPRGVGKTSMARVFAKTINCLNRTPEGEACNQCESCKAFDEQRSLNIYELDAASNNTVDDIRQLIEQVQIPPQIGRHKIYIIDEVHMLSQAAFNAFLKTLEEPPEYVIFILATTEKHKILPTILSRCQIYDFKRIAVPQIVRHLSHVAQTENIEYEEEALGLIAEKADGGMRDALSLFDRIANFGGGRVTYQDVVSGLNVLDYEYYFRLIDLFVSGNYKGVLLTLDELLAKGFDAAMIVNGLASFFRDLLMAKDPNTAILLEKPQAIAKKYVQTASTCSSAFLYQAIRICVGCDQQYRQASNKRLLVELALMSISALYSNELKSGVQKAVTQATKTQVTSTPPARPTTADTNHNTTAETATEVPKPAEQPRQTPPAPLASTETNLTPETPIQPAQQLSNTTPKPSTRQAPIQIGENNRNFIGNRLSVHGIRRDNTPKEANNLIEDDLHESFTENELQRAWLAYTKEVLTDQVHLRNTMQLCLPKLLDKADFEVKIYNPAQQEELEEIQISLMSFLRSRLRNTELRMKLSIEDVSSDEDAITNAERIERWRKENPNFDKLYQALGLREN